WSCWSVPLSSAPRHWPEPWSPAFRRSGSPWRQPGPGWDADERGGRGGAHDRGTPPPAAADRGWAAAMTSTHVGLPDRYRPLAEGVAEAHRVGLPVGGLTPENVVLRPNGLVGLRGVPAATGTVSGDVTALGALLELCLTGTGDAARDPRRPAIAPDLAALVRR